MSLTLLPTPPKRARVYVSSPLGFTEFGRLAMKDLYERLQDNDFDVRDPWDWPGQNEPSASIKTADLLLTARIAGVQRDREVSREIAARNVTELKDADVVLAILDGADVDSGVAAEIGYASAIRKPVVGLRTDARASSDSSGHVVNLQVAHLIAHSPHGSEHITTNTLEAIEALRTCVVAIRDAAEA